MKRVGIGGVIVLCAAVVHAQTVPPAPGTYLVWDQVALSVVEAQGLTYKVYADAEIASTTAPGTLLAGVSCAFAGAAAVLGKPSPDPSYVTVGGSITDTALVAWTINGSNEVLRNAVGTKGFGSAIYWTGGVIYTLGTDGAWYSFTGGVWKPATGITVKVRCSTPFPKSVVGVQHSVAVTAISVTGASAKSIPYTYIVKQTAVTVPLKLRTLERK